MMFICSVYWRAGGKKSNQGIHAVITSESVTPTELAGVKKGKKNAVPPEPFGSGVLGGAGYQPRRCFAIESLMLWIALSSSLVQKQSSQMLTNNIDPSNAVT